MKEHQADWIDTDEIKCKECDLVIDSPPCMIGQDFYHKPCFNKVQGIELPADKCYGCGENYKGVRVVGGEGLCDKCLDKKIKQAELVDAKPVPEKFKDIAIERGHGNAEHKGLIQSDLLLDDDD